MILMGCSPVGTVEPKKPTHPPPSLPVSFSSDPEMLALWEEIKRDWLTTNPGKPLSILEREVDKGFRGFERGQVSELINTQDTIEPQEILEYAYSRQAYYGFLVRHGFPVPFAMDDFDPETRRDAEIRERLLAEVRRIKAEYDASPGVAESKGSDAYKIELATRIREGLRHYADAARNDCNPEMPDWKAIDKQCGACTEFSAILHFAYKHADLDPRFMSMVRTDSSIRSMYPFFGSLTAYGHQIIGIPLFQGRFFYSDLVAQSDTSQNLYRYAIEISPRHFVTVHLANTTYNVSASELLANGNKILKVAPEVLTSWVTSVTAKIMTHSLTPEKFETDLEAIERQFGKTALVEYEIDSLRESYNRGEHDIFTILRAMDRLDHKDPAAGLMMRVVLTGVYLHTSPQLNKAFLYDMIRPAVDQDPNVYAGLSLLHKIAEIKFKSHCRDKVEMYRDLNRRFPDHHTIKMLLASACLECWHEERNNPQEISGETTADLYATGISIMRELADKIESEAFEPHFTLATTYYSSSDYASASTESRKVMQLLEKESEAKIRSAENYAAILAMACTLGDTSDVLNICAKFQRYRPDEFPGYALYMLHIDIPKIYGGHQGKSLSPSELEKRSENVRTAITALSTAHAEQREIDRIKMWHTVSLFFLSDGDKLRAGKMVVGINLGDNKIVDEFADILEAVVAPAIFAGNRQNLRLMEQGLEYFNEILPTGQKKPLVPVHIAAAIIAYDIGDQAAGKRHIGAAFKIDAAEARRAYFDQVYLSLRVLVTPNLNITTVAKREGLNKFNDEWNEPRRVHADFRLPVAKAWRRLAVGYDAINDAALKQKLLKDAAELERLAAKKGK